MTLLKTSLLVAFVLATVAVLAVSSTPLSSSEDVAYLTVVRNDSHNLVIGNRQYNDKLIYNENIAEKFLVSGKKLILERNIDTPANYVITQVRCLDQAVDGTGAEPSVTAGGPGLAFVNLRFKSQRWHGIYFKVEVYAKSRFN